MNQLEGDEAAPRGPSEPKNQEHKEHKEHKEHSESGCECEELGIGEKMQATSEGFEESGEQETKPSDNCSQAQDSTMNNGAGKNQIPQSEKDTGGDEGNVGDDSEDDNDWIGSEVYYLKKHDNHHRSENPIEERREKREKQRRQHHRYVLNLDDRVDDLEKKIELLLGEPKSSLKKKIQPEVPRALPEIATRTWDEFFEHKGLKVPLVHPAIEILTEDPVIVDVREPHSKVPRFRNKHRLTSEKASLETASLRQPVGPMMNCLPERIRVNAEPLCTLIRSLPSASIPGPPDFPVVLRRPFKILLQHEDTIRREAEESKKQLQQERNDHEERAAGKAGEESLNIPRDAREEPNTVTESSAPMGGKNEPTQTGPPDAESSTPEKELLPQLYRLLVQFIDDYIKPTQEPMPQRSRVQFHELWYLYHPGQLVYNRLKESAQKIWRIAQVSGGHRFLRRFEPNEDPAHLAATKRDTFSPLTLDCFFLASDGSQLRPVFERFTLPWFEEDQPIKNLQVLPLEVAEREQLVNRKDMIAQGEQYLSCVKKHQHRIFSGRTLNRDSENNNLIDSHEKIIPLENIDGAVMVDVARAFQFNPSWLPDFDELEEYKPDPRESENPLFSARFEQIEQDFIWDVQRKEDYFGSSTFKRKIEEWARGEVSGEDLMLLPDRVPAFVLRTRKWAMLQLGFHKVDGKVSPSLKPMDPDPLAWNDLKLPNDESPEQPLEALGQARKGHKSIIKSLVDKHFAKDMEFDLVRDKGRGLIVLLHGVPGVGKTSTAECVALAKGRPLLPITCGDLGLEPEKVEANLSRNFELAQAWDCILLLDEADVFLASRSLQDLQRNALVSVFLRILEYYEGILFLTTNRVGHIDEAFKSRIHMALYYPPLTEDQTLNIWKTLMRKAKEAQKTLRMDENTLFAFAMKQHFEAKQNPCSPVGPDGNRYGWNGRQIRNAFMSAIAIAQYEAKAAATASGNEEAHVEVHLKVTHFKTVSQASDEFEEYLWRTRGKVTYSTGAENEHIRYDRFEPPTGGYAMRPQQSQQTQQRSFHQQSFAFQPQPQPQPPMQHQQFSQPNFTTGVQNQGYGSPAVQQGYNQHMSSNPQGYYPAEGGHASTPGYANQPQYSGQNPGQMMPPPQPQQGMPL